MLGARGSGRERRCEAARGIGKVLSCVLCYEQPGTWVVWSSQQLVAGHARARHTCGSGAWPQTSVRPLWASWLWVWLSGSIGQDAQHHVRVHAPPLRLISRAPACTATLPYDDSHEPSGIRGRQMEARLTLQLSIVATKRTSSPRNAGVGPSLPTPLFLEDDAHDLPHLGLVPMPARCGCWRRPSVALLSVAIYEYRLLRDSDRERGRPASHAPECALLSLAFLPSLAPRSRMLTQARQRLTLGCCAMTSTGPRPCRLRHATSTARP